MIGLGANYSASLRALLRDPQVDFQAVKATTGSYLKETPSEIRAQFPDKSILYHQNSLIRPDPAGTDALVATMQSWQRQAGCPWLSAHIDYYSDQEIQQMVNEGQRPPRYDSETALGLLRDAVMAVKAQLPVPLLLENMPHWPLPEIDLAATPPFIRRVVEATDCDFLLDTAHARISAAALGWDVHRYLEALPLERTVEIHVSGPGLQNGKLWDLHQALQEIDYAILEWLLHRTRPRVVTLEYWQDPARLREQLIRLRQVIDRSTS